ncbi:MAG TPA: hypothetical protein VGE29_04785 [Prosthecobacter sp.]
MATFSFPIAAAGDVNQWFTLSDLKNAPFILALAAMALGAVAFFIFLKK